MSKPKPKPGAKGGPKLKPKLGGDFHIYFNSNEKI